jgi:hypothetical protein
MSLISNGINSVRAFALPCGIWANGRTVASPRTTLVKWRSVLTDVFYQVYVNGKYAGTTLDTEQRRMVVPLPSCLDYPVRIEVFAIESQFADADFSGEFDIPLAGSGRVRISMLRSQDLPPGATAQIFFDNGTSQIDYENPLSDSPVELWPAWQDKAGFGMSRFGLSDFGYDSAAAVGFGRGSFGNGRFGLDEDTIEWISPPLQAGVYKFAVVVIDEKGNQSSVSETESIMVTPAARPAGGLEVGSFDKQSNELILKIA